MKQLVNYINHHKNVTYKMLQDDLSPLHISMYNCLFYIWNQCGFADELNIVRSEIMQFSKIGSANTYTKVLKELDSFGYLKYKPSHNPLLCSKVTLITFDNTSDNTTDKTSSNSSDNTTDNTRDTYNTETIKLLNLETIKLLNENFEIVNQNLDSWIKDHNKKPTINEEQINEIYELYPTKCPYKKSSTGKSLKDKDKIKTILKTKTFDEVKTIIQTYLEECEKSKTWLKNFSTFLNNLPEPIKSDEQTEKIPNNDSIVVYTDADAFDPKREEKVRKEVFDDYVQRGKPVNFIRYARI